MTDFFSPAFLSNFQLWYERVFQNKAQFHDLEHTPQSRTRTQSPQALWPAVGRQERLWRIRKNSKFWLAALQQPALLYRRNPAVIKFQYPRVSPGDHPPTKEPEDSGYEIGNASRTIWFRCVYMAVATWPFSNFLLLDDNVPCRHTCFVIEIWECLKSKTPLNTPQSLKREKYITAEKGNLAQKSRDRISTSLTIRAMVTTSLSFCAEKIASKSMRFPSHQSRSTSCKQKGWPQRKRYWAYK